MKIKNKYLIVLFFILLVFVILGLSNKVSAFTLETDENNYIELPDFTNLLDAEFDIVVIVKSTSSYYLYVGCSSSDMSSFGENCNSPLFINDGTFEYINFGKGRQYYYINGSWHIYVDYGDLGYTDSLIFYLNISGVSQNMQILYSNYNIKNVDGEIFFQKTAQLTLGEVLEINNPVKIFQIMTHGIIPYLIVFIVGLVAFWKAWQLLLKELRKA